MTDTQPARKFAFDVSWVFIGKVLTFAISALLGIILGRFLGAASLGLYAMTITIYTIASLIAGFGIAPAIVKYVAEYKGNKEKLNIFVSCGVINSVFLGAISGAVLFAFASVLASIFSMPELTDLIEIIAFAVPFLVVNSTLLGLLNGLREMKAYSLLTVIRSVLLIGCVILSLYVGWDIKGAVLAQLLSEVGILFLLVIISRNFFRFVIRDYVKTTKAVVKFGSQLLLASAIWMVNTNADKLMVGYFLMDKDVGIYTIALVMAQSLMMIPGAMSTVTYPALSEYNGKRQHEAIETMINKSMKYTLVILSILGILIIFFSKDIILLLLKPEFLPAVTPLTILVFGMIFFGAVGSVGSAFSAVGRPDINYKVNIPILMVNLGIDIALIPRLGIIGAAIATATSLLLSVIIDIFLFYKILDVKTDVRSYALIMTSCGLMIAFFFMGKDWINPHLLAGILSAIYLLLINRFLLKKEDKVMLLDMLRNLIEEVIQKLRKPRA